MFEILDDRSILLIKGPDSICFLQNFTTNDIENNKYTYNFLLNNQGRYLFDFFVFKQDTSTLYIDCSKHQLEALKKRLMLYKLRSHVEITDVSDQFKIIFSKSSDCIFAKAIFELADPRYPKLGNRILVRGADIDNKSDNINGLYLESKYEFSIIDGHLDLEYEKSIPIEFGAEELNAISYTKGCYVGQEVISRAKYQGVVRKKIFQLKFATNQIKNLSQVEITDKNGEKIGKVCSNNKNLAIAQIKEEKFLGLSQKIVIIDGGEAEIIIPVWLKK